MFFRSKKEKSFKKLYLESRQLVRYTIYYTLKNNLKNNLTEDTNDLLQEVFIKAWNAYERFDDNKASFKTWIYNIAKNTAIDFVRKIRTENIDNNDMIVSHEHNTESLDIINILEEKYREVLILFYKHGYNITEIAKLLDIPAGTVKSRLFYAKARLQEYLNDEKEEFING